MPIHPVTVTVAPRTGQIDGENQARGIRIPLADLLNGVTGLELGLQCGHSESPPLPTGAGPNSRPALAAASAKRAASLPLLS